MPVSHLLAVCMVLAAGAGANDAPAGLFDRAERPVLDMSSQAEPWGDTSRRGVPFSKDPSVVRFKDAYWLYYSMPPCKDGRENNGWAIGVAQSDDLADWKKMGGVLPAQPYEAKGLAAPCALVMDEKVHLFYQTYGNRKRDAICHATSEDGLDFTRNQDNPIFRPEGEWTVGRAIDAEAFVDGERLLLYFATRDPSMKVQMVGVAATPLDSDYGPETWELLHDGPILKPELKWEKKCIEAPALLKRDGLYYMFYAGAYNNEPQQVGCAVSTDAVAWTRLSDKPFLPNGEPSAWNESESGHPGVFVDTDGQTYLFFQGNDDDGRSWRLSHVKVAWE